MRTRRALLSLALALAFALAACGSEPTALEDGGPQVVHSSEGAPDPCGPRRPAGGESGERLSRRRDISTGAPCGRGEGLLRGKPGP